MQLGPGADPVIITYRRKYLKKAWITFSAWVVMLIKRRCSGQCGNSKTLPSIAQIAACHCLRAEPNNKHVEWACERGTLYVWKRANLFALTALQRKGVRPRRAVKSRTNKQLSSIYPRPSRARRLPYQNIVSRESHSWPFRAGAWSECPMSRAPHTLMAFESRCSASRRGPVRKSHLLSCVGQEVRGTYGNQAFCPCARRGWMTESPVCPFWKWPQLLAPSWLVCEQKIQLRLAFSTKEESGSCH
jgi:hypothetical protein